MSNRTFRILSLSGGGVRGIFQAVFLKNLEDALGPPLYKHFDLVAGTSNGAIIAVAVALGIDLARVVDFYKGNSEAIFSSRRFYSIRKGARYNQKILRQYLVDVFENNQIKDAKTKILITASCIDRFSHYVFSSFPTQLESSFDAKLSVVDVVLASSAAPTYFPPIKPLSQERSFVDGGLWANSPSLVAVLSASCDLDISPFSMRLLSVGTGDFPQGFLAEQLDKLKPMSSSTIETIFELMFSCQQSAADGQAEQLIGRENFLRVSPQLESSISLDDTEMARKKLPPLAEMEIQKYLPRINMLLTEELTTLTPNSHKTKISNKLMEASGLTAFYPSRKYYQLRDNAGSIDGYISKATKSVAMVSINLMTGMDFTNMCQVLKNKLEDNNAFTATISLLNPDKADLIFAISPVFLNRSKEKLCDSIKDTLTQLLIFKSTLSLEAQKRFEIRVHNTIPFGSAIILDHAEITGRIQIETKPYKAVLNDSFAFEVAPFGTDGFYDRLLKGYEELMKDGHEYQP